MGLHSQLGMPEVFSMCFGSSGGILTLGEVDKTHISSSIQYTPAILKYGYWATSVSSVTIGSTVAQISSRTIAMIDSGTTLMLVDSVIYSQIQNYLTQTCTNSRSYYILKELLNGYCVQISSTQLREYPDISVTFQNSVTVTLTPSDYLRQGLCIGYSDLYVFGIANGGDMNIFGITFMQPYTWIFDRENERIGFAPVSACYSSKVAAAQSSSCRGGTFSQSGFFAGGNNAVIDFLRFDSLGKYGVGCALVVLGVAYVCHALFKTRKRGFDVVISRSPGRGIVSRSDKTTLVNGRSKRSYETA
eukprot:c9498_g1_i4.p1 GENE.c9498_g1_i4~~c9498_g1_i4.p1  ORF type:complete len:303 (+),score=62.91 c9498_g1_i4:1-909(+)